MDMPPSPNQSEVVEFRLNFQVKARQEVATGSEEC